jgi:ATP-dependent protease ClpP protease subunit
MTKPWLPLLLATALTAGVAGCSGSAPSGEPTGKASVVTLGEDRSAAPVAGLRAAAARPTTPDFTYWPPATLDSGTARVSCHYDYDQQGDGERIGALEFFNLVDVLSECREAGMVRLRYRGKIDAGFTALLARVTEIADRMEIRNRVLDIDSAGGQVEEAIRVGDQIAESRWSIWVREGSLCHSACVLVLAAGDTRSIAGKVGIHRLMRLKSTATTRVELNDELRDITRQLRDYLSRNGVGADLADRMMTIPARNLLLLTSAELRQYGLSGTNAAQEDLDRIRVARKCGEDFARRRDAFGRAFDNQCMQPGAAFEALADCGRALRGEFGFPDERCPDETPLARFDTAADPAPPSLLRQ